MLLSQTYADLGCPVNLAPMGLYLDIYTPMDAEGHGSSVELNGARQEALAVFQKRVPPGHRVLNAKITAHNDLDLDGCACVCFRVVGDLYKVRPRTQATRRCPRPT